MTTLEKDQHYAALNVRFDNRSAQLRAAGFRYERIPVVNIAIFTKTKHGKTTTIAAGTVLNADEIVWADESERIARG